MTKTNLRSIWNEFKPWLDEHYIILLVGLGLIVGLFFVFIVPPWMHYDEPGHLEYAWLIANRPGLPKKGDYDQTMRRQISASIIEYDIEGFTYMTSDPLQVDQPIDIWVTHIGNHPPTYYFLASLPLRLFRHTDIVFQLYLVRLVSLVFYLGIIWVAYQTSRTLFGTKHPLSWMVPLFLITLPAFVDVMTAANNDVAAVLAFSLFTWASVVLIKQGFSLLRFTCLAVSVFLCLITKNTAWLAAPLSLLVLIFALLRGKRHEKLIWIALGALPLILLTLAISWQRSAPAFFYSAWTDALPERITTKEPPIGQKVMAQNAQPYQWRRFYILLTPQDLDKLSGQTATLGAWIWADSPTAIRFPGIEVSQMIIPTMLTVPVSSEYRLPFLGSQQPDIAPPIDIRFSTQQVELEKAPQFFAFAVEIPPLADNITWVYFPPSTDEGNRVYWDGIVLVPGDFSDGPPPVFDGPDARSGTWQGVPFDNLIRNASGQRGWPVFSDLVLSVIPRRINPQISGFLSIFDFQASAIYYRLTASRVFRTFWAVFGWANIPLYGQKPYRFLFGLTFVYLIGMLVGLIRKTTHLSWQTFTFLGLTAAIQIMIVIFRGVITWFSTIYIPVGRYLYPAILSLGVLFMIGVESLIRLAHQALKIPKNVLYGMFVGLHMGLILWGMFSVWLFYHRL